MAGGHDQLFKDLLRAFPADFLRLAAEEVAQSIDLAGLELEPAEVFLDQPRGAQRRLDLVTRARALPPGSEPALLHVEVELRYRASVAPRLWLYNLLLQQRHGLPVHTLVLYLRGGAPGARTAEYRETSLGQELCLFRYRSLGLSRAPAEAYLERPEPLAWALAALMRAGVRDPRSHRRACLARIAAAENLDDVRRFLLFNCVATYLELDGRAEEEFAILLAGHGESEGRTMMTWEEKIEARGMREVLLSLLLQRFEPLPAAAAQKVATMTSAKELRRLADRLLSARSLEELGLA